MSLRQSATCKSYMSTCINKDPLSGPLVLPKITILVHEKCLKVSLLSPRSGGKGASGLKLRKMTGRLFQVWT